MQDTWQQTPVPSELYREFPHPTDTQLAELGTPPHSFSYANPPAEPANPAVPHHYRILLLHAEHIDKNFNMAFNDIPSRTTQRSPRQTFAIASHHAVQMVCLLQHAGTPPRQIDDEVSTAVMVILEERVRKLDGTIIFQCKPYPCAAHLRFSYFG